MNSNERTLLSNQSDHAPDVPYSDELNPLMNPLLSANMGRWADVYFNNPPEQREQAVLSLVHELQVEKTRREEERASGRMSTSQDTRETNSESSSGERSIPASESDPLPCAGCGHENPRWHKFCGMCGAAVVPEHEDAAPAAPESRSSAEREEARSGSDDTVRTGTRDAESPRERRAESEPFENSITNPHELSLFRSFREADSTGYEDDEPRSHVRLYLGAVLVVLILGLGYMGWKDGLFRTQSSQEALPPTSSATKPDTPPEAVSTKPSTPESTAPAKRETAPAVNKAAVPEPASVTPKKTVAEKAPAKTSAVPKPEPLPAAPDYGNQELATAKSYLNGTGGQMRNSALAAQWLWKSIAKHNGPASVLLADLYLKGDGVPKNCDQARVLLDSAAMKGVPGAGTRLRNLQAFGCQ
jgi:hypothetical protein